MSNITISTLNSYYEILRKKPLLHHITNSVTINDCANVSTALGALPIMASDLNEVSEITSKSDALILNTGTPSDERFEAMRISGIEANKKNIPIILDPVGISASYYRLKKIQELLKFVNPTIIKGNLSEIMTLCGVKAEKAKGVDSLENDQNSGMYAKTLAKALSCVVVITGEFDVLYDGNTDRSICLDRGSKMMKSITGGGCMTTSVIAAFASVSTDYYISAMNGVLAINIAAENTVKSDKSIGSGTFKVRLIDNLFRLEKTLNESGGLNE